MQIPSLKLITATSSAFGLGLITTKFAYQWPIYQFHTVSGWKHTCTYLYLHVGRQSLFVVVALGQVLVSNVMLFIRRPCSLSLSLTAITGALHSIHLQRHQLFASTRSLLLFIYSTTFYHHLRATRHHHTLNPSIFSIWTNGIQRRLDVSATSRRRLRSLKRCPTSMRKRILRHTPLGLSALNDMICRAKISYYAWIVWMVCRCTNRRRTWKKGLAGILEPIKCLDGREDKWAPWYLAMANFDRALLLRFQISVPVSFCPIYVPVNRDWN